MMNQWLEEHISDYLGDTPFTSDETKAMIPSP